MTRNNMTDPRSALAAILAAMPGTCTQLGQRTGYNRTTPLKWVNRLHGKGVYICGWMATGRCPVAIWAQGNRPDVQHKAMTGADYNKRYREKLRMTGEYDFVRAKRRAQWHADKHAQKAPQGPFAALFSVRSVGGRP